MSNMNFGVGLFPDKPSKFIELVREVEDWGFGYVWIPDDQLYRDVYVNMALCALNTNRIKIGSAVTNPVTRHPAITAVAIATIDELSGERAILGMGTGGLWIKRQLCIKRATLLACREAVYAIKQLLAGKGVVYSGKYFKLKDAKLKFKVRSDIPIYVSASGPKAFKMAGEIADGAIVSIGVFREAFKFALERIREGVELAGKNFDNFDTVCWVVCSMLENIDAAKEAVKPMVAWSVANTPFLADLANIDKKDASELRKTWFMPGGVYKAIDLVTDEMIEKFAIAGTADNCIEKIRMIGKEGIKQVAILSWGQNPELTIKEFAERVMRSFLH